MQFKITINGTPFIANMDEINLVNEIEDMTPFKIGFKRYKGHEYFAKLKKPLNVTGEKLQKNVSANDIVFYSGENAITFFFKDDVIDPYEVIYLGKFKEDISEFLASQGKILSVQFETIS